MGWLDNLKGSLVGVDTVTLIYYIERKAEYISLVDPFFDNSVKDGEIEIVASKEPIICRWISSRVC
jgi:hypothetical protein